MSGWGNFDFRYHRNQVVPPLRTDLIDHALRDTKKESISIPDLISTHYLLNSLNDK